MDVAVVIGLAWVLIYVTAFAGSTFLIARKRRAFTTASCLALSFVTFLFVGFGVADGIGLGAAILPFGLLAMGALAGAANGARWLAGTAAAMALGLASLMVWGPFKATVAGIPQPPLISVLSWLAWGAALLALTAAAVQPRATRGLLVAGAVLLWTGMALGPLIRTFFVGAAALVASAAALSALIRRASGVPASP